LTRPAHQQRQPPAGVDVGDGSSGASLELGQPDGLIGVSNVNQVVRDAGALLGRGFGRADAHPAIKEA